MHLKFYYVSGEVKAIGKVIIITIYLVLNKTII